MSSVLYRNLHHNYPVATHASGMYITDKLGNKYLDMCGGAAVSCLGHGHPAIIKAAQQQLEKMAFAHTGFFTNEPQEQLASKLRSSFGDENAKVYFSSGGSEANETALKLAWQYWRSHGQDSKIKIISREHSYHGNTFATLSASGHPTRRKTMDNVLLNWPRIPACYAYRNQLADETDEAYSTRAAAYLETAIIEADPKTVAAFIAEPVVGASLGAVAPTTGYFARIREICDKYDILFIADEVMCGTGRTGSFYALEQENVMPDIVTLAKGIGGGVQPLAATVASSKIVETFKANKGFSHGHTYIGHATACAAGLAVCETIETYKLLSKVKEKGQVLQNALKESFSDHHKVGDIRGRGLFQAIELVEDKESKTPLNKGAQTAQHIQSTAMQNGLMIYPSSGSADHGNSCHILIAPPFTLEETHIEEMIEKLTSTLAEVFA